MKKAIGLTLITLCWSSLLVGQDFDGWQNEDDSQFPGRPTATLEGGPNEITAIRLADRPEGRAPQIVFSRNKAVTPRPVSLKRVEFKSSNFVHRQLLFEQPLLERHGISRNEFVQPVVSGIHFLGSAALFPPKLIKRKHQRCDSSLGWGIPDSPRLSLRSGSFGQAQGPISED